MKESGDSLSALSDLEPYVLHLTIPTLRQPVDLVIIFLLPPSTTLLSDFDSPDLQPDKIHATMNLLIFAACSITSATTGKTQSTVFLPMIREVGQSSLPIHATRTQSQRRLCSIQKKENESIDIVDRLAVAWQHLREQVALLAPAVKSPRLNSHLPYESQPETSP